MDIDIKTVINGDSSLMSRLHAAITVIRLLEKDRVRLIAENDSMRDSLDGTHEQCIGCKKLVPLDWMKQIFCDGCNECFCMDCFEGKRCRKHAEGLCDKCVKASSKSNHQCTLCNNNMIDSYHEKCSVCKKLIFEKQDSNGFYIDPSYTCEYCNKEFCNICSKTHIAYKVDDEEMIYDVKCAKC